MAVSTQEQKLLIKLVISMLGIAPGHTYMPVVEQVFEDLGHSLPDSVSALAALPQFQARYPAGMAGDAFASQFLAGMGLQADAPLHRLAADLFNAGVPPQQIMLEAVLALASPGLPAQYAAARALLDNKAEVAYYYAQVLGLGGTDFTALAKVLENVTQDPASAEAAKLVLSQPPAPDAGGGGGGPPPVFAVTKGVGDIASFTLAGTQIDVTEAGGTFTFTSSGGSVGTATLPGPLAGIIVPGGSTLAISSALAGSKAFSGAGTALVVANAGGEDLTAFSATGVTGLVLTSGQNYTLTAAQAAIGRIGTGGAAGTLTDAGTTTVRDTLAALGGGVASALKANGADSVIATAAPGDISGTTVAGTDSIFLATGSYTMTAAQAALANGAMGSQTVTLTTQATGVLAFSVESFVLGNFANSVTLGAPAQNLSSPAGTGTTLAIAGTTPTGTWALAHASNDTLVATNGANISGVNGGNATTADKLMLTDGITMTQAQHEALASIAASGSSDSVTITTSGTVTTRADVETYKVSNSGTPNTVTVTHGTVNVTGGSGNTTVVIDTGVVATGTYNLQAASDSFSLAAGMDLSGVNGGAATTAENLSFSGAVKMTQAQHEGFTTVSAPVPVSDSVEITTGGSVTAKAGIETYILSAAGPNTVTVLAGTNVTGRNANATTINVGGGTVTGNYTLANGADLLKATDGAHIAGATTTTVESLELSGAVTMTAAQYIVFTAGISATGNNDRIILTTALNGGETLNAAVESFTLAAGNHAVALGAAQAIDAQALTAGQTLTLGGGFAANVTLADGNLSATGATVNTTVTGGTGANTIALGSGSDTVNAGGGADFITGGGGNDTLNGDAGNDTFLYGSMAQFISADALLDLVNGGNDIDTAEINGGIALTASSDLTRMTSVEQIKARSQSGTNFAHSIVVDKNFNLGGVNTIDLSGDTAGGSTSIIDFTGVTNAMTLKGVGLGANTITGGSGADTLVGGTGNDLFLFGSAAAAATDNAITGGGGADTVLFRSTTVGETLVVGDKFSAGMSYLITTNSTATAAGTTAENINASTHTLGGVTLTGNAGNNSLTGTADADTLKGNGGVDVLRGGGGNDTINTFAGGTTTYVFEATASGNGTDTLTGVLSTGKFDFSGFLSAGRSVSGSVVDSAEATVGLNLSAGDNIGVRYRSTSLFSTDIRLATNDTVAGEVAVADNGKAVVFSFGGPNIGSNANGSIYYVEDTNSTVGVQSFTVTLVGTMTLSSATIAQIATPGLYL